MTERLYSAFLLVFTGYRPKTHDLKKLGEMSVHINEKLKTVFPMTTQDERIRFELLRRAYIDARYKKEYEISKEDLEYLSKRVEVLREVVKESCGGKVG